MTPTNGLGIQLPIQVDNSNRAAALRLSEAGLPVFPARVVRNETTERWDKVPLVAWREQATTDPDQIATWWEAYPEAVPGIELGRAGLIAIDCDRHGGPDGVAALEELQAAHERLPLCPITLTAGDGKHLIFRQPVGTPLGNGRGSLPVGIDVRGSGGWIVGPGSLRPDGAVWASAPDRPCLEHMFMDSTIPMLPEWIVDLIRSKPPRLNNLQGSRSVSLGRERIYAKTTLDGCVAELSNAPEGERNEKANAVAYRMGGMVACEWITRDAVIEALFRACDSNGLVQEDGLARVHATLNSGLDAGLANPHEDLRDRPELHAANDNDRDALHAPMSLIRVRWDGETNFTPVPWLVRDLIPKQSVGLLVGESQSAKSFVAVRLAISLATGEPFFHKPTKRGGVVYIAAEAAEAIYERLEAARLAQVIPAAADRRREVAEPAFDPCRLPIAVVESLPDLARDQGARELMKELRAIAAKMTDGYGVPLSLVIVDTMLAAFGLDNWNDAAQAARASSVLAQISVDLGVTVLGVHHHGKDVTRGAAGSFALTAGPDFILSTFRDAEKSGAVDDRWIALTKSRRGPTGWQCRFDLVQQKLGQDEDGCEVISAFIEPQENIGPSTKRDKKHRDSGSVSTLKEAVIEALAERGESVRIEGGDQAIQAVRLVDVRHEFECRYKPRKANLKNRSAAVHKAFGRGLAEADETGWLNRADIDGTVWVWPAFGSPAVDAQDTPTPVVLSASHTPQLIGQQDRRTASL